MCATIIVLGNDYVVLYVSNIECKESKLSSDVVIKMANAAEGVTAVSKGWLTLGEPGSRMLCS